MTLSINHVRELHEQGAVLYCWSSGGGEYAREIARECGLEHCFVAFLPKPNVLIDDQNVPDWRRLTWVHPLNCSSKSSTIYREVLDI